MTSATPAVATATSQQRQARLLERFSAVRGLSERIVAPLEPEDCVIQSMPDVSPTRWHLAHTTWFFETFLLRSLPDFRPQDDRFAYLFNSYYNAVGEQFPRHRRGLLSRPTVADVLHWRQVIDAAVTEHLSSDARLPESVLDVLELGLHHEQQHQELMLTDIKHVLACNPLDPQYTDDPLPPADGDADVAWTPFDEGIFEIGADGSAFCFDNELPRHRVLLEPFELRNGLVTNGEYLEFIRDGGYQRPELWLSLGWADVQTHGWRAPLYWQEIDGQWTEFTLAGRVPVETSRPVCHVSYFEADAFARWCGARLPTEAEWETAAADAAVEGRFCDRLFEAGQAVHPGRSAASPPSPSPLFGDVWEWTSSSYAPYPGYAPPQGALGEYNGKFMCNQYVLRGGSCATPTGHIRPTYRNFFPPDARWQFTGIRLARNL